MRLAPGKYLKSETNGHTFVFDEVTASLPQMRVIQITGNEPEIEDAQIVSQLTREDLEALYIEKFKRKPHPKTSDERLRAALEEADGNDHSAGDH